MDILEVERREPAREAASAAGRLAIVAVWGEAALSLLGAITVPSSTWVGTPSVSVCSKEATGRGPKPASWRSWARCQWS